VKYGPNTPAVERLLKQLKGITPAQIVDLETIGDVARYEAWSAAWDAGRNAAWSAAWSAAWDAIWDMNRSMARDAAWDAVLALVVRDKISEEHFKVLYGPWKKVMDK
jgi:hypothetical protein